ncbi:hypothetical protein AB2553_28275 [Bacillus mycoides]|uniref:hypothetical protein n=1 Tax=Bacillus mycoides TaxID=1405 RepID=UPI003463A894
MTELLTQLMIIIGMMVLVFIVYTVSLQQVTQDIVRELLNQKEIERKSEENNKKDTIQMKS